MSQESIYIGKCPVAYATTATFVIEKTYDGEPLEVDTSYTVKVGTQEWTITADQIQVEGDKIILTWIISASDFTVENTYKGCLTNDTKEINKYTHINFSVDFEDHC